MGNLDVVLQKIEKKYGKGTVIHGNQYPKLPRISSGIFSLDMEIGGGVPKGRVLLLVGQPSTGKSLVAQKIAASFQYTCRECLGLMRQKVNAETGEPIYAKKIDWATGKEIEGERGSRVLECPVCGESGSPHTVFMVDTEGTYDATWFETLGGDSGALYLFQPEYLEQMVDVVNSVVRTGQVDLVIIDSIAQSSPAEEIIKSAEDAIIGKQALITNRLMRLTTSGMASLGMMNVKKPTIVIVNQLREKVGTLFGKPTTVPGGRGQLFASSITIEFSAWESETIEEPSGDKDRKHVVGQRIRFEVTKNKTFPPKRAGFFVLYTDDSEAMNVRKGEVDNERALVEYGQMLGIVQKNGSWYTYGDVRENGIEAFRVVLLKDPEIRARLWADVVNHLV